MSDPVKMTRLLADTPDRDRALALYSTHTNLSAVLGLLQIAIDDDDIEGIDERLEMLAVLIERHRKGHGHDRVPPRREYQGTVEVGYLGSGGVMRVETDRFNLWLYPVEAQDGKRVQVEIEAR